MGSIDRIMLGRVIESHTVIHFQPMKLLTLVQHIIISIVALWSRNSRAASAAPELALPVAKSNCTALCGSVSIPYPFGIGPDSSCYFDEWFQIDCNNSVTPILRRSKLEVLNITVKEPFKLRVKNPVTFFNCKGKEVRQPANLTGSPFVYSQEDNKFVAVSCDFLASAITDHDSVIGACSSKCVSSSDRDYDGCDTGINCCRAVIPPDLTVIISRIQAQAVAGGSRTPGCDQYAFLVDEKWFENNISTFRDVKKMESVPVVLEWSLSLDNNKSLIKVYEKFKLDLERYPNNSSRPYCEIRNATSTNKTGSKVVGCNCRRGFEGNPFLLQPCVDIDECKELKQSCIPDSPLWDNAWNITNPKCENIPGGHRCSDSTTGATCVLMAVGGGADCYLRHQSRVPRRSDHQNRPLYSGLGSSLGVFLILICAWWAHKYVTRWKDVKRKEMFFKRNGGLLLEQQISFGKVNVEKIKLFNSSELEKSTDNFSIDRVLGQGGQGTVFKGMLADGTIVAVKKSKIDDEGKVSEFINEVVILSQINHRNIVQLFGCCLETEVPLLVYEFIPNGTLSQYIQEQSEDFPLTWKVRLRIATEVAAALSYLHIAALCPIYHRDIKSANILLDEKYRAKIADFGTSRSVAIDQTHLTTNVYGTFGYLDPEYFQSSQFTEKSDVYSFGVVLVEFLTGRKAISVVTRSIEEEEEYRSLATHFIVSMQEDRLFNILDARVVMEGSREDIMIVANLARRCLNLSGRNRPTMREVTAELEAIRSPQGGELVPENDPTEHWDDIVSSTTRSTWESGPSSSLLELT